MKHKLSIFLMAALMVFCFVTQADAAEVVATGECGESATYSLYDDGHLVISGSGDFIIDDRTWYKWNNEVIPIVTAVTIEDSISTIGECIFQNCENLTEVTLPSSLTKIGDYAFACTGISNISFPDGLLEIGNGAFSTTKLSQVTIPNSVATIHNWAFGSCQDLTEVTLGSGLTSMGGDAFQSTAVKEVVFPVSLDFAGGFPECRELVSVTLPEGMKYIGTFSGCIKLESINVPDTIVSIDEGSFIGCESLKSFDFNNAATNLRALDPRYIEHVKMGKNDTWVPQQSFWGWDALKSVEIRCSGHISENAFVSCANLETVILGDHVSFVAAAAFWDCPKLTTIDFNNAEIASPKWHGQSALQGCGVDGQGPSHVTFGKVESITDYACSEWSNLETVIISEGVELIGIGAFEGCGNLKTVVLPDSLKGIGDRAFCRCTSLESIIFGSDLELIGFEAFAECYNLKDVTFRDNHSLISICGGAFYMSGITSIDIPDSCVQFDFFRPEYSSSEDAASWMIYNNNKSYDDEALPTFGYCENLVTVHMPENLEYIPEYCFQYCDKLESTNIPDSCKYIGEEAFIGCTELKTVTFGENVEEIHKRAFYRCGKLESAIMQDKVYSIDKEAFAECTNLENVRFSNTLGWIGDGAFYMSGIREVILPDTFQRFSVDANTTPIGTFAHCYNLETVVLNEHPNFYEIPAYTFNSCSSLKTIELPLLRTLGDYCFASSGLSGTIILPDTGMELGENCFLGTNISQLIISGCVEYGIPSFFTCPRQGVTCYYDNEKTTLYSNYLNYPHWIPFEINDAGEYLVAKEVPTEAKISAAIEKLKKRTYPEGYPCDQYAVSLLNSTSSTGYGSQAFAYAFTDELFGYNPAEAFDTVTFADVQVGDILRIDNDSRAVVVVKKTDSGVEVVQGDWNGTVHWGETLTKEQVEAADYRISRYGMKVISDTSAIPEYEVQFRPLPTTMPTEQEAYERIRAMESSFAHNFPFSEEVTYMLQAENKENVSIGGLAAACCAFANMASDIAFGTVPMYEYDVVYEDIMVGDLLDYDPDPSDPLTHIVVVLEVYSDCIVVAEGNMNGRTYWGRVIDRADVETMFTRHTRYPEGTVAPTRPTAPENLADKYTFNYVDTTPDWEVPTEPDVTPNAPAFSDVPATEYYAAPVAWAASMGITTGTSDTTFSPNNDCTRGQIVTFIWRAKGEPEPQSTVNPFTDVKPTDYFYKAVLWAVEQGITNGLSETTFGPEKGCTRGQVCTFLWRAQGQPAPQNASSPFSDVTGDYYYNAVLWAVENNITNGMGDGKFAPNNICTRGQIVTFLYRSLA